MSSGVRTNNLMSQYNSWVDRCRNDLSYGHVWMMPIGGLDARLERANVFERDVERLGYELPRVIGVALIDVARHVAGVFVQVASSGWDGYRYFEGSLEGRVFFTGLRDLPLDVVVHLATVCMNVGIALDRAVAQLSTGVGMLAWHGGEWAVSLVSGESLTVLSTDLDTRRIVYGAVGITLLAAGALCVPVAAIQLFALPILAGSIYGMVNNQFTVRECPEYYTMGHYYDGVSTRGHGVRTNNLIIKPFVTGCYATTMVTKYAGAILSLIGTLPYTSTMLPVTYAVGMIAGVCAIGVVAAHIFAMYVKNDGQGKFDAYAEHVGFEWTDEHLNMTWFELQRAVEPLIEQKRANLNGSFEELEAFNAKLETLTNSMCSYPWANEPTDGLQSMPLRYVLGWQTNSSRNMVGYATAGVGTALVGVASIALRIFVI
ncbi:MAG: hypothetical protein S4CHLAM102_05730 [Chlamydiia bacterium]|nr:hypothetical protein [Chlamydiia bacterium]